jgi:hypothetical protein
MKTQIIHLTVILALVLCMAPIAIAQFFGPTEATGMFGPRTIGGPMMASQTEGMFGPRTIGGPMIYFNSSGMFGYQIIGPPMGAIQYTNYGAIRTGIGGYVSTPPVQIGEYQVNLPNQGGTYTYIPPQFAGVTPELSGTNLASMNEVVPYAATAIERNIPVDMVQAGQNPPLPSDTEMQATGELPAAASNVTMSRPRIRVEPVAPTRTQSFVRSQKLSEHLTTIARDKGMLAGESINVYLSNNVALVQGRVRSPADRVLLANVLSLSPEVGQIDNRLAVGKTGN